MQKFLFLMVLTDSSSLKNILALLNLLELVIGCQQAVCMWVCVCPSVCVCVCALADSKPHQLGYKQEHSGWITLFRAMSSHPVNHKTWGWSKTAKRLTAKGKIKYSFNTFILYFQKAGLELKWVENSLPINV